MDPQSMDVETAKRASTAEEESAPPVTKKPKVEEEEEEEDNHDDDVDSDSDDDVDSDSEDDGYSDSDDDGDSDSDDDGYMVINNMRLKVVREEEPEWDVDSFDGREYESDPEVRKLFADEKDYEEYRLDEIKMLESKGFIPDFTNGIYDYGSLDEPCGENMTIKDDLTDLASLCINKLNEDKGTCVKLEEIVGATVSGGFRMKVYITFMAREDENGPLVEYQAKALRYCAHRQPYVPILCRPSPKPNADMIWLCHSEQLVECDIPLYAQNIELIDLQGCTSLQSFPDTSQLQHLRVVNLSGCIQIKSFQGAPNIEELHLQGTSIKEIPTSIMSHSLQKVKLHRPKLLNLLGNFQDVEYIDLESVTELVKVSSHNQGFGKLVYLNMKDCSHLRSLPDMVTLESLQVLHLSGCSKLKEIKGFPKNMRTLYIGGTALQEVPQFPKTLEFLNAHGCTYLKSVCLDFEQLPVHYTFSNCFNSSLQVIAELLEKGLTRIASLARSAQQQGFIKAPEVSICIPAGTRQRSSFLLEEGPNIMANLDPWTRKPLSGFFMSIVVSFQDDCHNTTGLDIKCICTWKDMFDSSDKKIERMYQCWAPGEAPKVEWHPSGSEVKFEFHTVSQKNELLGANCRVTQCGVQIITAPTNANDTIPSEITREREATSISNDIDEEHHSPTSSRVVIEAIIPNPFSSIEPLKVSSKLRSKGTMVWKWLKRIRRDKKKESLPDREHVHLTQPFTSMIRSSGQA